MASPIELTTTRPEAAQTRAMAGALPYTTGSVRSKDGTPIGYRRLGGGPGIVVLHGAMESAQSHMQLAEALSDSFTVYLMDRRGRGLSGPFAPNHSAGRDVEDVQAIVEATGADNLFGVSSGGAIGLQAALTLTSIRRAAVYEPALVEAPDRFAAAIARYEREMAEGKTAAALVTAMKLTQMGPRIFNVIPGWLLTRMTGSMLRKEDRSAAFDAVTMRKLAPTLHCDFADILELSRRIDDLGAIGAQVLLLGGSKSPAYLRRALDLVERAVPGARRVEFPGLGHGGSGNADWGGKPAVVADQLRRFFA